MSKTRLIRAAGLRWPVEEGFEFGKGCIGLDQSQVRVYHAIARHTVLVMAALAICAVTAALLRDRTEITRLLAVPPTPRPPGHTGHWTTWRRRHQARARWHHHRARLTRGTETALVSPAKGRSRTTGHP